jgi:hypothetical protein
VFNGCSVAALLFIIALIKGCPNISWGDINKEVDIVKPKIRARYGQMK